MFLVPNIDQMYKEMKKIVEVGNKHGNGDEFPDFADLFFFWQKIVRVGVKILGSVDRKHTFFFGPKMPNRYKFPAKNNRRYVELLNAM